MRNFFAITFLFLALVLVGCDASSNPNVDTRPVRIATPTPTPAVLTPSIIGVSPLAEDFVKHPDCDGGACLDLKFVLGIELAGEAQPRQLPMEFLARETESVGKGVLANDVEIKEGKRIYALIKTLDPKQVRVTLDADNKVSKVEFVGQIIGQNFAPGEILWQSR